MRRREMENFINEIISRVETIEYTDEGEEGNVYIDEFARQFFIEYTKRTTKEKVGKLLKFMRGLSEKVTETIFR